MKVPTLGALLLLGAGAVVPQFPPPPPVATDVVVHGRVVDAQTGQPIAAAQVEIIGSNVGNITSDDGYYELRDIRRTGRVELRAVSIGYGAQVREVRLREGRNRVDFTLAASAVEIEAIIIEGERNALAAVDQVWSRAIVTGEQTQTPLPSSPDWNREQYAYIAENAFVSPVSAPLSTFGADVDRASYANVRRFLMAGVLPQAGAVRIEEMINYFEYDYPEPRGNVPFSVTTELAPAPWRDGHLLLRVGIQAERMAVADMPPANLVFLLDVSGSMSSPDKLPLVREALPLLVERLRPDDRVAIVVYAGNAGVVLPSTPGSQADRILAAIARLQSGGSTAGGAGLRLAYRIARENFIDGGNNRVILATDGDFNVGESSDDAMTRLIEEERESGIFISVLGFGTGNLQDAKMESIADHGNGNYFYVDDLREAKKVFVQEIAGTLVTVAKDVKIQIEFNPERVAAYRLIGYENRALEDHEFDEDSVDSGDIGAGHSVTALYEIVPAGADTDVDVHAVSDLRYQRRAPTDAATSRELGLVRIRFKEPDGETSRLLEEPVEARVRDASADMRFAAAVAGFGMLLRESAFSGDANVESVRALAGSARGDDEHGHRAELLDLIDRYAGISSKTAARDDR